MLPSNKARFMSVFVILTMLFSFANVAPAAATGGFHGTWSAAGSMATARYLHTATLLPDGKVLVAGGYNNSGPLASAELYDPALGTWSATGSMANARYYFTLTLLPDGKVLVAGGVNNSGYPASAELYDPATGTWSATGSLTNARYAHTATLLPDGKVLVTGGFSNSGPTASAELYDPATGTWSATGSLTDARSYHTAALLPDGKVLVAAGYYNIASAELYDPATGTWSLTGSMTNVRYLHTATLLPDGKVLVAAGYNYPPGNLASVEIYDSSTGTWNAAASLINARQSPAATLLPDGKVLVSGGYGDSGPPASAEIYDPATGIWSITGSMTTARYHHTATLLSDGKVLATGGYSNSGPTASAELYVISLAPAATNDAYNVDEDQSLIVAAPGVLGNDPDPQGDSTTASLVSSTANGMLIFNSDGSFTYTPDPDFSGQDSFTYTASDGIHISVVAKVNITVNAVNDAPVVDLNGADGSGIDFSAAFDAGDPPVLIGDLDLTLTDADSGPVDVASGNGMIYVLDYSGRIVAIDPTTGTQTTVINSMGSGYGFYGIAIDSATQELFVTNYNGSVEKVDIATGVASAMATDAYLYSAFGIDLDPDGNIVVATYYYGIIRIDGASGAVTQLTPGSSLCSYGLAVEEDGDILVADLCYNRIVRVDPVTGAQTNLTSDGAVQGAYDIAIDAAGDLFVVELYAGGQITQVDSSSGATTQVSAGSSLVTSCSYGIEADEAGNLITVDYCSGQVAETEIDTGAQASLANVPLYGPFGVAVDAGGGLQKIKWATLQITNLLDGANEVLSADTTGTNISAGYASGTLSLTGDDTVENYQTVLRTVTYSNAAASPSGSNRIIDVVVFDGTDSNSPVAKSTITLAPPDSLAPTASPTQSPAANGAGWNKTDVTVTWNWADNAGGSGIDNANCTTSTVSSSEGNITLNEMCKDLAGNTGTASYAVKVDKTLPTVSLVGGPANSGSYYFGSVPAAPTCLASDVLSGLDGSCTVSGYSVLVGPHTVSATAQDIAGNQNSASASYTVLAWTTNGFFQPVDMGGVWNTVKGGSTVPLKFEVFAGATELTSTSIVNQPLTATQTLCTGGTTDEIELLASGATSLRYDATSGQFIYNWKTPQKPGYCYVVTVKLEDGTSISANFKLK
jgi:uncharacterized delta-60 repeat protein